MNKPKLLVYAALSGAVMAFGTFLYLFLQAEYERDFETKVTSESET
jgi:hypothetical protein